MTEKWSRGERGIAIDRSLKLIRIDKDTPRIVVSPEAISHAFIEATAQDREGYSSSMILEAVLETNKQRNSKLWDAVEKSGVAGGVTYASFRGEAGSDGYPRFDPAATFRALQGLGLTESSSLVVARAVTTFDGGHTRCKVQFGFAFRDRESRLISQDGDGLCIPPAGYRVIER